MSAELNVIALAVGAALILVAVHGFRHLQMRSVTLQRVSAIADGRLLQLVFVAFVAALAAGGKAFGVVLPGYVERFLPDALEAIVGGLLASEVYRAARRNGA